MGRRGRGGPARRRCSGCPSGGAVDAPPGTGGSGDDGGPAGGLRGRRRRPRVRPASACLVVMCVPAARSSPMASRRTTACGPASRSTGSFPTSCTGCRSMRPRRACGPRMSLHARPVRVLDLPAGWGISYGPTFRTARPSRIATLPLGYGDGWSRSLSNRAEALVRGMRVPLVGNVAMDAVMADVTDVPGAPVTVARRIRADGPPGRRRDPRSRGGPRAWDELLGGRHGHGPPPAPGVPCRVRTGGWSKRLSPEGSDDASRSLERGHLRPRGGCDRESGGTHRCGCPPGSAAPSSGPAATRSSSRPSARAPFPSAPRS